MSISGFTMVRNADKYYFPIKEAILSILPIVDEFIVALGDNDEGDKTLEFIESINSDKIKIYHRVWSEESFIDGKVFADETNFALSKCSGDWCFYLQADEVIHENDLGVIKNECERQINNPIVDGLLFNFLHFWGDYNHYLPYHGWLKNEVRVVRNNINVYSRKDAASFRKGNNEKLRVKHIDADIYHYGWVRPPALMQSKQKEQDSMHHGKDKAKRIHLQKPELFNYGALGNVEIFKAKHPEVMKDFIAKLNWKHELNYTKKAILNRPKEKHEKLKYRIITYLENKLNKGKDFVGYSNWEKV